jgi:hypothetical protein
MMFHDTISSFLSWSRVESNSLSPHRINDRAIKPKTPTSMDFPQQAQEILSSSESRNAKVLSWCLGCNDAAIAN